LKLDFCNNKKRPATSPTTLLFVQLLLALLSTLPGNLSAIEEITTTGFAAPVEPISEAEAPGPQGATPLHTAAFNGQTLYALRLLHLGIDPNARLKTGNTPLHLAALRGHALIAELLIGHGAEVNSLNDDGDTPLDMAIEYRHEEVARILLGHHANSSKKFVELNELRSVLYQKQPVHGISDLDLNPDIDTAQTEKDAQETKTKRPPSKISHPSEDRCLIQLASLSPRTHAMTYWQRLQTRFSEELGSLSPVLQSITVNDMAFTRVQAGPVE